MWKNNKDNNKWIITFIKSLASEFNFQRSPSLKQIFLCHQFWVHFAFWAETNIGTSIKKFFLASSCDARDLLPPPEKQHLTFFLTLEDRMNEKPPIFFKKFKNFRSTSRKWSQQHQKTGIKSSQDGPQLVLALSSKLDSSHCAIRPCYAIVDDDTNVVDIAKLWLDAIQLWIHSVRLYLCLSLPVCLWHKLELNMWVSAWVWVYNVCGELHLIFNRGILRRNETNRSEAD